MKSVAEKSVIMRRVHTAQWFRQQYTVHCVGPSSEQRAGCDGRLWGTMTKVGGDSIITASINMMGEF